MKFGTEVVLEGGKVLGGKFITQKLLGTPNLVGLGHLLGPQIWICKDLGPVCFWSRGYSLSWGVYKTKVVVYVPNSAWPLRQGIGLERPAGPWKTNVWLSPHTLVICLYL